MQLARVVGIDMGPALEIGVGDDRSALSDQLPAERAGLVETLCSDVVRANRR